MTTYNNILDFLKEHRERVIEAYGRTSKGISLKEYMNIVIWFFDVHPGKARKVLKGSLDRYSYLCEALELAERKSNAKERKALCDRALAQHIKEMNCEGWYRKNFQ